MKPAFRFWGRGALTLLRSIRTWQTPQKNGGIAHSGFRLVEPGDIDAAVAEVKGAGGKLIRRGEFAHGLPFAYVHDPDSYEIEIWYD
jgi:catechol 2,3-dioxygenase-like lactoylglutathione lyase family enzyme